MVQKYGSRAAWEDPTDWVISSCPLKDKIGDDWGCSLLRITVEDAGCDSPSAVSVSAMKSDADASSQDALITPEAAESLVGIPHFTCHAE